MCRITTMEQLVQEGSTSVAQLIIRNNDFPTHYEKHFIFIIVVCIPTFCCRPDRGVQEERP